LANAGAVDKTRAAIDPTKIACLIRMEGSPFSKTERFRKKDCDDFLPRRFSDKELLDDLKDAPGCELPAQSPRCGFSTGQRPALEYWIAGQAGRRRLCVGPAGTLFSWARHFRGWSPDRRALCSAIGNE
jgi:hypothetical protein